MKGHAKRALLILIAVVIGIFGFVAIACGSDDEKPKKPNTPSETVSVTYYGELSGIEYKLAVENEKFTLTYGATTKTGKITIADSSVTLSFSDGVTATGTKSGTVITVQYNGATLKLYEDITYTVKFDSAGGSAVTSQKVRNGKKANKPTDPKRNEQYKFDNWYKESTYKNVYNFSSEIVTGDITLYAKWLPVASEDGVEFTVNFDLNYEGAPAVASQETVGGMISSLPSASRTGYDFKGWWISMTGEKVNGAPVLSYQLKENQTVLAENTTAYAVWQTPATSNSKLPAPMVDVNDAGLSWAAIANASGYDITVEYPNGTKKDYSTTSTSYAIDFTKLDAGDYTISVIAKSLAGKSNYSDPTVRVYRNKALARVSKFEVKDGHTLTYNKVKNATKYLLYIQCGDANHQHFPHDNGTKDSYDFASCTMQVGGIKFYVVAEADGYASSTSAVFTYDKKLDAVDKASIKYDEKTETVSWTAVANATGYKVKIGTVEKTVSAASIDVREYDAGTITISVQPIADGYNSPAATTTTFTKTTLAAPANVRLEGNLVKWNPVTSATKYFVEVAGKSFEVNTNQIDLTKQNITWEKGKEYIIVVKAANATKTSPGSVELSIRYKTMGDKLSYENGYVTWDYVFGATGYDVRVNGGSIKRVTDTNTAKITFTKAGDNKIEVRFADGSTTSEWVSMTVKAYSLTYDLNGAEGALATQYYAKGDTIDLYLDGDIGTELLGHYFGGWYTSLGDNAQRFTGSTFNFDGNATLYARWNPRTYTVTLNYGSLGSGELKTVDVVYGSAYSIDPPTTITDGTMGFIGWYRGESDTSTKYTDEYGNSLAPWNVAGNLTLYAQYKSVLKFVLHDDGYWVEAGEAKGAARTITIPEMYEGIKVSSIGKTAFNSARNLEIFRIPASIVWIDLEAFQNVTSIKSFEVYHVESVHDDDAVYRSHDGVLFFNDQTEGVSVWAYPRAKDDVVYTLPNFVETIPNKAFYYSKFEEIVIPTNVRSIQSAAFFRTTNLTTVTFLPDSTYEKGVNGEEDKPYDLTVAPAAFGDSGTGFNSNSKITKVVIPARLSDSADGSLNVGMFFGMTALTTVEVDSASKYKVVDGMVYLPSENNQNKGNKLVFCPIGREGVVTIPSNIAIVGPRAFAGTRNITDIIIPTTVSTLEKQAFSGYRITPLVGTSYPSSYYDISGTYATTVTFKGNRQSGGLVIGESAFGYDYVIGPDGKTPNPLSTSCFRIANIVFEDGCNVTEIGSWAFAGCYSKELTKITIPNSVVYIGDYAFRTCRNVVTFGFEEYKGDLDLTKELRVGSNIFFDCSALTEITLPYYFNISENEDGTMNDGLFAGCSSLENVYVDPRSPYLTSQDGVLFNKDITAIYFYPLGKEGDYELPDTIEVIGSGVFSYKPGLTGIIIHNKVKTISAKAFEKCPELAFVEFRGVWTGKLDVQAGAFTGCDKLTTITFPVGLTTIADSLFTGCDALESVNIPSTVTYIGKEAFKDCKLYKGVKKQDGSWELVIPKSVVDIGHQAFYGCKALTSVIFEDGRTTDLKLHNFSGDVIGLSSSSRTSGVFYGCSSIASITLVNKMSIISDQMFFDCSSLTSINIPTDVIYIGELAFLGCTSLETFTFAERTGDNPTPLTLGGGSNQNSPFRSSSNTAKKTKLKSIKLPRGLIRIPRYTFADLTTLEEVWIPASVHNGSKTSQIDYAGASITTPTTDWGEAIGAYAFSGCTNLKKVEFETGGTGAFSLGQNAFYISSQIPVLTEIELPSRLAPFTPDDGKGITRHVIESAFYNQVGLRKITVQPGGKYVGRKVGEQTVNGKTVEMSVLLKTEEEGYTLVYCPLGITGDSEGSLTIPYDVTGVTNYSFYYNINIKTLTFEDVPAGTSGDYDLVIGDEVVNVSSGLGTNAAFYSAKALTTVNLPARLTKINTYAFNNVTQLKTVNIADGSRLESIGESAFYKCAALTSINLPDSLKSIGAAAFDGLTKLVDVRLSDSANKATNSQLQYMGDYAFRQTAIKYFYVSDALGEKSTAEDPRGFGTGVFARCSVLASVSIPATVSSVNGVFTSCAKLGEITIRPVSGKTAAISGDKGLLYTTDEDGNKTLVFSSPGYKGETVDGVQNVCVVPDGVVAIADGAFANNGFVKEVRIPTSVKSIGVQAFQKCWVLEKVSFYDTVTGTAAQDLDVGDYAFDSCIKLSSVSFPAMISRIGEYAFSYTYALKSTTKDSIRTNAVIFASGTLDFTTIDKYAFYYSGIDYIDLPTGLQIIDNYAFRYSGIKEITIPNTVTSIGSNTKDSQYQTYYYGDSYTFADCAELTSVTFASGGTANLKVHANAFDKSTQLSSVTLCSRLVSISPYMFRNTAITSIDIPDAVTEIGGNAFNGCAQLETVSFGSGSKCTRFGNYSYKNVSDGKDGLFSSNCFQNSGLKTINIPAAFILSTTNLAVANFTGTKLETIVFETPKTARAATNAALIASLFDGFTTLKNVTLPGDLVTINNYMFRGTQIKSITIPDTVKTFADGVFQDCTELEEVIFEEGTVLTSYAGATVNATTASSKAPLSFQGCTNLKKVVMPGGILYLGINIFNGLEKLEEVELQEGLTTISDGAFYGTGIRGITIPSTVTTIGKNAFRNCANLGKAPEEEDDEETAGVAAADIEVGVTFTTGTSALTMGDNAFYNTGLTSIEIPARLTSLGENTFAICSDLTEVTFASGSTLATIGNNVFWGTKITSIDLPNTVTSLGSNVFRYAPISSLVIPASVTSIGVTPFMYCDSLASISFSGDNANYTIEDNILYNKDKTKILAVASAGINKQFVVADSVKEIADEALLGTPITSLEIGDDVAIGLRAFASCKDLANIALGDNVFVDDQAFALCGALTTVTIGEGAELSVQAFADCDLLVNVTVGAGATFGSRVFENCDALEVVTATEVAAIGHDMFKDCAHDVVLSSEDAPVLYNGFEMKYDEDNDYWYVYINSEIGNKFMNDTVVEHIVIGPDVTAIPASTFAGCSALKTLVIEEGTANLTIGASAFANCTSLEYLYMPKRVQTMGDGILTGSLNTTEIVTPFVGNKRLASGTSNTTTAGSRTFVGAWYGLTTNSTSTFATVPAGIKKLTITDSPYLAQYAIAIPTLEELVLEHTTTIGAGGASYSGVVTNCGANIKKIDFGENLIATNSYMLATCTAIEEIYLPASLQSTAANTFTTTLPLERVYYRGTLADWVDIAFNATTAGNPLGNGIAELYIDGQPASGEIVIPAGTASITAYKFYRLNGVTKITIPDTVKTYGNYAFYQMPDLQTVIMGTPNQATLAISGTNLFQNCTSLSSVTLPENLVTVGNYMFAGCSSLEEIELPGTFKPSSGTSGANMFQNSGLKSIDFPASVTILSNYMFNGCVNLQTVNLPATIVTYGSNIFKDCTGLETVVFETGATPPTIGANMFDGCSSLTSVTLPTNLVTAGNYMFANCTSLEHIDLPETFNPHNANYPSYTTTGTYMFQNSGLKSIVLPSSMSVINNYMFAGCAQLTKVTLPENITNIGTNVFQNCVKLESIEIPDSVTAIDNYAFAGCAGLTNIKLSNSLLSIGNYMFDGCTAIENITIPESVNKLGTFVFRGCDSLKSIFIPSGVNSIGADCFSGWGSDKTINTDCSSPMPDWDINWNRGSEAAVVWDYVAA